MDYLKSFFKRSGNSFDELYISSDLIIWASCIVISISVIRFIVKKPEVPHRPVFWFLGILLLSFGFIFLFDAVSYRWPIPGINLTLRLFNSALCLAAMVAVYIFLPRAMAMKTPAEFEAEIAERKKSEQKFMGLLESAPDSMIITDRNGKIMMVNKQTETLFGFERNELIGREVEVLIPDKYHSRHKQERQGYAGKPKVRPMGSGMDLYGKRKDGSVFPVEVSLSPLQADKPEDMLIIAAIRDVTRQKKDRAEIAQHTRELEVKNRELEAFSYTVSHDLKAPLRSITSFSRKIAKNHADNLDEQGLDYLNRIRRAGDHMNELIDGLLKLAKLSRVEINPEYADLSSLAQAITEDLKNSEPDRKVEIIIQPGLFACADKNLMQIALQNLFDNAWKYSKKQAMSKIEFGSLKTNGHTVYFVKDNGVGFDMKYADRLFRSFQRLHQSHEFEGTGIGLASVQRIIHRHNGTIWVESELNKGATFFFTIQKSN